MKLRTVQLHNYRCFPELRLDLDRATVLIGTNNAGKSTILTAIADLFGISAGGGPDPTRMTRADFLQPRRSSSEGDLPAISGTPGTTAVIGEFEVMAAAGDPWPSTMRQDMARYGRRWSLSGETRLDGELCLLLTEDEATASVVSLGLSTVEAEKALDREDIVDEFGYLWLTMDHVLELEALAAEKSGEQATSGLRMMWWPSDLNAVLVPGPDRPQRSVADLLRPLLFYAVDADLVGAAALGRMWVARAEEVSATLSSVIPGYLEDAAAVRLSTTNVTQALADLLGKSISVEIARPSRDPGQPMRVTPLSEMGAGARRAAALAALEAYRGTFPADGVIAIVEEPETGLHPSAQHRVADSLRRLSLAGVQTIVSTHSPIFVNATDPDGLRIVRHGPAAEGSEYLWAHEVVLPTGLSEIVTELGATPADVLLARRFVVVEGETELQVLPIWALKLHHDLRANGVQMVPAHGQGSAPRFVEVLTSVYPTADVFVLLDGGPETEPTEHAITDRHPHVKVRRWRKAEIEAYYASPAIVAWIGMSRPLTAVDEAEIRGALMAGVSKQSLRSLSKEWRPLLPRTEDQPARERWYEPVGDGKTIANLTAADQIDDEIRDFIESIVLFDSRGDVTSESHPVRDS